MSGDSQFATVIDARPAKPSGYEDVFGDYSPQFYEAGTPVLWGFETFMMVVVATIACARGRTIHRRARQLRPTFNRNPHVKTETVAEPVQQ